MLGRGAALSFLALERLDVAKFRDGQMLAGGTLARALTEQLASNQPPGGPVEIGVSFRARDGGYCRSFVLREQKAPWEPEDEDAENESAELPQLELCLSIGLMDRERGKPSMTANDVPRIGRSRVRVLPRAASLASSRPPRVVRVGLFWSSGRRLSGTSKFP